MSTDYRNRNFANEGEPVLVAGGAPQGTMARYFKPSKKAVNKSALIAISISAFVFLAVVVSLILYFTNRLTAEKEIYGDKYNTSKFEALQEEISATGGSLSVNRNDFTLTLSAQSLGISETTDEQAVTDAFNENGIEIVDFVSARLFQMVDRNKFFGDLNVIIIRNDGTIIYETKY